MRARHIPSIDQIGKQPGYFKGFAGCAARDQNGRTTTMMMITTISRVGTSLAIR